MNLIDYNEKYLTVDEQDYLKGRYTPVSDKQRNIYNFIEAYIKMVRESDVDPELFDSLKENNKIKIIWSDCIDALKMLPKDSVSLMVTSPPYYNARAYSQWNSLKDYLDDMEKIISECFRVLENHRVFVFNVSDVVGNDGMEKISATRKIPLPAYFITLFEKCGFTYVDDIIWNKGEVQSSRHKSKNKPYPFFQYPCNCYEHILIFHKHQLEKDTKYPCNECGSLNSKSNSYTCKGLRSWECTNPECTRSENNRGKRFSLKTITVQNPFKQESSKIPENIIDSWRKDIHNLSPVIKINSKGTNSLGHTAPFPKEIPEMAVYYFSYSGEIVLDPFAGSFTSAIVANKLGRIGVGIEKRKDLFETAIQNNLNKNECEYDTIELV